jgi:hypothetical protein
VTLCGIVIKHQGNKHMFINYNVSYEERLKSALSTSNDALFLKILAEESCPETVFLADALREQVCDNVFSLLKEIEACPPETWPKILRCFALIENADVTLTIISVGLTPNFPVEILCSVFAPVKNIVIEGQWDDLFALFFCVKRLALEPENSSAIFAAALRGFQFAIELYPESGGQSLGQFFLIPASTAFSKQCAAAEIEHENRRPVSSVSDLPPPSEDYSRSRPNSTGSFLSVPSEKCASRPTSVRDSVRLLKEVIPKVPPPTVVQATQAPSKPTLFSAFKSVLTGNPSGNDNDNKNKRRGRRYS